MNNQINKNNFNNVRRSKVLFCNNNKMLKMEIEITYKEHGHYRAIVLYTVLKKDKDKILKEIYSSLNISEAIQLYNQI